MVGPLPGAWTQKIFILAAIYFFTNWVEAKYYTNINDNNVRNFLWKNIVCRFGIPRSIVSNNGTSFMCRLIKEFTVKLKIKHFFSTPLNPQSNGQEKSTNKTLINCLMIRLKKPKTIGSVNSLRYSEPTEQSSDEVLIKCLSHCHMSQKQWSQLKSSFLPCAQN